MSKLKYERKGKLIQDLDTKEVTDHKSKNKAKKASRLLQMSSDGGLGRGCLEVIK